MCATQMNTSDNPGLWDMEFSSWVFCEFNATVKSLCNRLVLASTADLRSPCSSDQRRFGRLPGRQTPHRHAHCTLYRYDKRSLTRQTVIFTIAARFSHEETWDWTHTYTQRDQLWRWTPHSTPGTWPQHDPVFSALYANFWGFLLLSSELT